jgi:hypothetical protein
MGTVGAPDAFPSGFSYYILVGASITTSGGNITQFYQVGADVVTQLTTVAGTASSGTEADSFNPWTGATPAEMTNCSPDTASAFQALTLTNCVPPTITARVRGLIGFTSYQSLSDLVLGSYLTGTVASPTLTFGMQVWAALPGGGTNAPFGFHNSVQFDLAVINSQTLYWTGTNTGGVTSMRVTGYQLAL